MINKLIGLFKMKEPQHQYWNANEVLSNDSEINPILLECDYHLQRWYDIINGMWEGSSDKYDNISETISEHYEIRLSTSESYIEFAFFDKRLKSVIDMSYSYYLPEDNCTNVLSDSPSVSSTEIKIREQLCRFDNRPLKIHYIHEEYKTHVPKKQVAARVDRNWIGGMFGGGYVETVKEWKEVDAHIETNYSPFIRKGDLKELITKFKKSINDRLVVNNIFINSNDERFIESVRPQITKGYATL